MNRPEYTPDRITQLEEGQIFVFGSNLMGHHAGGAARIAYERFGAVWGDDEIAPLFTDSAEISNIILPESFVRIISSRDSYVY